MQYFGKYSIVVFQIVGYRSVGWLTNSSNQFAIFVVLRLRYGRGGECHSVLSSDKRWCKRQGSIIVKKKLLWQYDSKIDVFMQFIWKQEGRNWLLDRFVLLKPKPRITVMGMHLLWKLNVPSICGFPVLSQPCICSWHSKQKNVVMSHGQQPETIHFD